jgi:hypothetical protein
MWSVPRPCLRMVIAPPAFVQFPRTSGSLIRTAASLSPGGRETPGDTRSVAISAGAR